MPLFNRLLKLKSDDICRLEDFFTEIVAHFLEKHQNALVAWLEFSEVTENSHWPNTKLTTQKTYKHPCEGEKRPDIVIELSDENSTSITFIESKIGSQEGWKQLNDYARILDLLVGYQHKSLVYITRDFDPKESSVVLQDITEDEVQFIQLRWYQFYQFLSTQKESELIHEIKSFMQEHRMDQRSQFSPTDVLALASFPDALKLMEAVLWDEVVQKFESTFGLSKAFSIRKRIAFKELQFHNRYVITTEMSEGFACIMGFLLKSSDSGNYPLVILLLQIDPSSSKRQEVIEIFKEIQTLYSWKGVALDDPNFWSAVLLKRSLRDFLSSEDHVAAIKKFFLDSLNTVEEIKTKYPHLPWGMAFEDDGVPDSEAE